MGLPTTDIRNTSPNMELISSGVVEPSIAAAITTYFESMTAYRAAQDAAHAGRVDMVPPNEDADLVARLILDARERAATPDRAREALLGELAAHHGDWQTATSKQLSATHTKVIKLLGQLVEQLCTLHALAGTAAGIATGPRFMWSSYDGSNLVHAAHTSAEDLLEHLRATEAANPS